MQTDYVFTSESVTEGHPDKLCDQISDALLGHFLRQDPLSQVVAECAVSTGILFISVKQHSRASVDVPNTARDVIRRAGYTADDRFDPRSCTVMTSHHEVRERSAPTVDERELTDAEIDRVAARDRVTVFGYACDHTPEYMPLPISLAHRLARRLAAVRREEGGELLTSDGKVQVAVEFAEERPKRIHGLTLLAWQRQAGRPSEERLRDLLMERVVRPVFEDEPLRPDDRTPIQINPEGPLLDGGPSEHAGLTGRKTAADTYGEFARHSGAALSGKDPSRIERVATYGARYAAKNVVAAGLASQCEVQLTYSLGEARPVGIRVLTSGSGRIPDEEIARRLEANVELRFAGMVRDFNLRHLPRMRECSFYDRLAVYGQVGRDDLDLPWERTDQVDALR